MRVTTIGIVGIGLLGCSGCIATLGEIRARPPVLTTSAHRPPPMFLACVREHIEEHHPSYQGSHLYEVVPEADGTGLSLIGRFAPAPADVRFIVTALPGETPDTVTVVLRTASVAMNAMKN